MRVLDLGCGEGTNAAWLVDRDCDVTAVDVSAAALDNARRKYPDTSVRWVQGDVASLDFPTSSFDLVVAYGLMHCLAPEVGESFVRKMQDWTKPQGFNVVVAFNDRSQDLSGHPGFSPTLRPHSEYCGYYGNWEVLLCTDEDLHETHPHNGIPHHHSMTRLATRKPPHD